MSDWSHGYNISQGYTYHQFREQSPSWLHLSTRLNHRHPPSVGRHYLELGCGQGFGLVQLAACYPKISFIGVDFHPAHIAHAQKIAIEAGLDNIKFIEADFLDLAKNWPQEWPLFDYVTLHGILSWVPDHVKQSLMQCLEKAIAPMGLVYTSYNALPGWTSTQPVQHLLRQYQLNSVLDDIDALNEGKELILNLIENGALIGKVLPQVRPRLKKMEQEEQSYLVHEYLHDNWKPFWFSEIAKEMAKIKLEFVGSATLSENHLLNLLPENLIAPIKKTKNPILKQELLDTCINQGFRRDVYQKGSPTVWPLEDHKNLDDIKLIYINTPEEKEWSLSLSMGTLALEMSLYSPILSYLSNKGVASIGEIFAQESLKSFNREQVLLAIAILAEKSFLACYSAASAEALQRTMRLNKVIAQAVSQGAPYSSLACAYIGSGRNIAQIDLLLFSALSDIGEENVNISNLSVGLIQKLKALGRCFIRDGHPVTNPQAISVEAQGLASDFLAKTLPFYKRLGAWGELC